MKPATIEVRFWGVRGSVATGGPSFVEVGSNTSCVEVRAGNELIILDAGTGLARLGRALEAPVQATILISHYHWDHIQGFPLFEPAYDARNTFVICGPGRGEEGVEAALRRQMQRPHFPVPLDAMKATFEFRDLDPNDELNLGEVTVTTAILNHPELCFGYRITFEGASVVFATDTEQLTSELNPAVLQLAKGADLLIYDAQYTEDEYRGLEGTNKVGWGHSTIPEACRIASAAGVKHLALFHHDPTHDDRRITQMVREARSWFPRAFAAREGDVVPVPSGDSRRSRRGEPPPTLSDQTFRSLS